MMHDDQYIGRYMVRDSGGNPVVWKRCGNGPGVHAYGMFARVHGATESDRRLNAAAIVAALYRLDKESGID